MSDNDASDPNIVARLKNIPPFTDEEPTPPVENEKPADETPVEEETPKEEPKEQDDDQKKRTQEQFEKLKEHNAQLKKELEEAKAKAPTKNALESLFPDDNPSPITNVVPTTQQFPALTNKEIKDTFAGLTDEQGYVDVGLLKETLLGLQKAKDEALKRASEAESRVQKVEKKQDDFERKQAMKEVHSIFPKLDPNNADSEDPEKRFDQRFYDQFRKETMFQWSTTGSADPMKVAEAAYDTIYGESMKKADKEKAEQAELAKRNINATKVKPASTGSSYKDKEELIKATRLGLKGALAERLARAGQ